MPVNAIKLTVGLTEAHQIALLNSIVHPVTTTPQERRHLLDGIDLLRSSRVEIEGQSLSFTNFFDRFIDAVYTDQFITSLPASKQIAVDGQKLKKKIIEEIRARFIQEQWLHSDLPATRFLIAFCLYWWNALAIGYIFEMEVFQDLQSSGLLFQAHDLRKRSERYSSADLTVSEWRGDVKSSTYFFFTARTSVLSHDFYVTRYYDKFKSQYQWFVILRSDSWNEIDGDTQPMIFPNWPANFFTPAAFEFHGTIWVAVSYQIWKTKMFAYQNQENRDES